MIPTHVFHLWGKQHCDGLAGHSLRWNTPGQYVPLHTSYRSKTPQGLNNVFWTTSQNPDDRVLREKWITFGVVWGHDLASTLKMLAPAPCHTQGGACVPSLQLLL